MKFMVRTNDEGYSFYVKGSGSNWKQSIYTFKLNENELGKWIEKNIEFTAESDMYDEFMIGAAQLKGNDAYVAFDNITILEKSY